MHMCVFMCTVDLRVCTLVVQACVCTCAGVRVCVCTHERMPACGCRYEHGLVHMCERVCAYVVPGPVPMLPISSLWCCPPSLCPWLATQTIFSCVPGPVSPTVMTDASGGIRLLLQGKTTGVQQRTHSQLVSATTCLDQLLCRKDTCCW